MGLDSRRLNRRQQHVAPGTARRRQQVEPGTARGGNADRKSAGKPADSKKSGTPIYGSRFRVLSGGSKWVRALPGGGSKWHRALPGGGSRWLRALPAFGEPHSCMAIRHADQCVFRERSGEAPFSKRRPPQRSQRSFRPSRCPPAGRRRTRPGRRRRAGRWAGN